MITERPYPSATAVARAIVAAARIANEAEDKMIEEDAESIFFCAFGSRARQYAFAALIEAFPDCPHPKISEWCGFSTNHWQTRSNLRSVRRLKWWSDDSLARVKAAIGTTTPPNPLNQIPEMSVPTRLAPAPAPLNIAGAVAVRRLGWPAPTIAEQIEGKTPPVAPREHAPKMLDRDPIPAPRKASRRVDVTADLMGDPGHRNPREDSSQRSKDDQ
jgi:hypothetical protein